MKIMVARYGEKIIILKVMELRLDLAYLCIMRSLMLAVSLLRFVLCGYTKE